MGPSVENLSADGGLFRGGIGRLPTSRSFAPPSGLPAISPSRGEISLVVATASRQRSGAYPV